MWKKCSWEFKKNERNSSWGLQQPTFIGLSGKVGKNSGPGRFCILWCLLIRPNYWWPCRRAIARNKDCKAVLQFIVGEVTMMRFKPTHRPIWILGVRTWHGDSVSRYYDKIKFWIHGPLGLQLFLWYSSSPPFPFLPPMRRGWWWWWCSSSWRRRRRSYYIFHTSCTSSYEAAVVGMAGFVNRRRQNCGVWECCGLPP